MGRLFQNIIEGATAGGIIGGALDALLVVGATVVAGPVGFAAMTTAVASKTAACTLGGAALGVAKTIKEEADGDDEE